MVQMIIDAKRKQIVTDDDLSKLERKIMAAVQEEIARFRMETDRNVGSIRAVADKAVDRALLPHICTQQAYIEKIGTDVSSIKQTLDSWKTLKLAASITVILAILSGGAYVIHTAERTDSLKSHVDDMKRDINMLVEANTRTEKTIREVRGTRDEGLSAIIAGINEIKSDINNSSNKKRR
jgi:anti-sigma-K factor RskA